MDETNEYKQRSFSLADGLTRRQAQKKLKNQLNHVQVMKKRIKVLTSQADYNKYRQRYQAMRIERHSKIHQEIVRSREQVELACKSFDHSLQKKSANKKLNQQIKEKLNQAFTKVKEDRLQQSKQVKLRSRRNSQFLAKRKIQNIEERRQMKQSVKLLQGEIRESISRYNTEKRKDLNDIKVLEKKSMVQISQKVHKQLEALNIKEKELIDLGSSSLQASRIRGQEYQKLYGSKDAGKIRLPGISTKVMDQSDTAVSD